MVKGVSRRVVVVQPDAHGLFEQAIFLVRDYTVPRGDVVREACRIANGYVAGRDVYKRQVYSYAERYGGEPLDLAANISSFGIPERVRQAMHRAIEDCACLLYTSCVRILQNSRWTALPPLRKATQNYTQSILMRCYCEGCILRPASSKPCSFPRRTHRTTWPARCRRWRRVLLRSHRGLQKHPIRKDVPTLRLQRGVLCPAHSILSAWGWARRTG